MAIRGRDSRQIRNSVVVVTGASSGIGRATALALAVRGADLVLVARDAASLDELARTCSAHGVRTVAEPADVGDEAAVDALARRAVDRFGRIDVWVNAASVTMFGALLDVPAPDVRRVLEVNLMGHVHGCRAALPGMIEQGHGVVVNVSSLLGVIALPYGAAYSMTKFGIRGLGAALRQELRLAGARGVHVCTALPAGIDTPIFAAAANHSGRRVRAVPPVYTPERTARAIVGLIRRPRRERVVGGVLGRAAVVQHAVAPALVERAMAAVVDRLVLARTATTPATAGNLYSPAPGPGRVHGGWNGTRRERLRAAAGTAAGVAAGIGAVLVARRA